MSRGRRNRKKPQPHPMDNVWYHIENKRTGRIVGHRRQDAKKAIKKLQDARERWPRRKFKLVVEGRKPWGT